jgi:hypothetical protein
MKSGLKMHRIALLQTSYKFSKLLRNTMFWYDSDVDGFRLSWWDWFLGSERSLTISV